MGSFDIEELAYFTSDADGPHGLTDEQASALLLTVHAERSRRGRVRKSVVLVCLACVLTWLATVALASGCDTPPQRGPTRADDYRPVPPNSGLFLPPGSR